MQSTSTNTIVYFKQGLGNLVLLTPTLQALAQMDASGQVDICLSSEWNDCRRGAFEDYIKSMPFIQDIINFPTQNFTKKYRTWFYTQHSEHSAALDEFTSRGNNCLDIPDWRRSLKHEAVWYFEHAIAQGYSKKMPRLFAVQAESPVFPMSKLNIGICNGTYCSTMMGAKQWPYFKELSEVLRRFYNCNIIKIGTGEELQDVVADYDFVNKLTFTQNIGVINQLSLFIVNDTANMHIGDALGINMLVIFGGSCISKNGPLSSRAIVLRRNLECQPCQFTEHFKTCEANLCQTELLVSDVLCECNRVLG